MDSPHLQVGSRRTSQTHDVLTRVQRGVSREQTKRIVTRVILLVIVGRIRVARITPEVIDHFAVHRLPGVRIRNIGIHTSALEGCQARRAESFEVAARVLKGVSYVCQEIWKNSRRAGAADDQCATCLVRQLRAEAGSCHAA